MRFDDRRFEQALRKRMKVPGRPPGHQVDASRRRVRERLLKYNAAPPTDASRRRTGWPPVLLIAATILAAAVIVMVPSAADRSSYRPNMVLRILSVFTKGMKDTAAPLPRNVARDASPPLATPLTAATPIVATGQRTPPEFEAASVKRCDQRPASLDGARGGGANSFQVTRGRLRALCLTTATLIRTAYGYTPLGNDFLSDQTPGAFVFDSVYGLGREDGRRVRGGPDWIKFEPYTIEAVTGRGASLDAHTMSGLMLRRLLEQRFQLKAHIEHEQAPAFALTVSQGGLKIRPVTADACDALPGWPPTPGQGFDSRLTPPRQAADVRRGAKPSCGLWPQRQGPNLTLVGGAVSLDELILNLGFRLGGVRVLNRTAINDRFNFIFEFALDESTPGFGRNVRPEPGSELDVPPATSLFSAIEDQLGLRLEPVQVPRDFIVVDHVLHPTDN